MAEKVLQTRIINKHADLATWASSTLPLKTGEIALARIEKTEHDAETGKYYKVPTYLMKVGDGNKPFSELNWLAAPASDVYEWAKQPTLAYDALPQTLRDEIDALQAAIGEEGSVAQAIATAIQALDVAESKDTDETNGGVIISAISETDGKISVTRRALTADDIPALGIGKITGLQDALNLKANASDVKDTTDAISARLDSGDIKQAIDAAKTAGDNAQAYAEGIYKVDGQTKTGVLAQYMTSNDAALDAVRQTAEAAQTATEVSDAIDAKITTYNNTTIKALDERVVANNTAISTEKSRAEGVESGLNTRLTTVEGKVEALSSATHFLGVKTELPATAENGDIVIVGNKEYVYDAASIAEVKWVELGDTTAEQARIKTVEDNVADILADLGAEGDTTKAIAAAQAQADKGVADAKTANDAIAVINGSGDGSIAKAVADATSALETYADGKASDAQAAAEATAKSYTDTEVKKANDAAAAAQTAIDTHAGKKDNPHEVTKAQVGLGEVENKSTATIKSEFTGAVADGNEGFVTGDAAYDAIEAAKTAVNGYTDTEVKKVDDKATANATDITTIKDNYARVSGDKLVYGQGDAEMVIIFDCGGAN